jgi:phosphatidylglycerophosphate synthase
MHSPDVTQAEAAERARAARSEPPTAAVVPGCAEAPERRICGLRRRERLLKTLERSGYRLVDDPASADRVVPDCRVLVDGDEMHLCTDGVKAVEKRLLGTLRKDVDGVISRTINRPISLAFTRLLMNTSIKPNHVTTVIMMIGMASGLVVAQGGYWAGVIGALLLNTQSVLDGTDGELARLRYQGSHFGQWFDTVSDDLSNLSFLIGATISATHEPILFIGLGAIAAFVLTQAVVYYALVTVYGSGNLQHFEWALGEGSGGALSKIEFLVKRDFFCFAFFLLAFVGRVGLDIAVVGSAVGAFVTIAMLARQLVRYGLVPPSKAEAALLDASQSGSLARSEPPA